MDQATEAPTEAAVSDSTETTVDAYEEHIQRLHARMEVEERRKPRAVTCNITFDQDEVDGLLSLIEDNIGRYAVRSQALLVRAATKLKDSLLIT